MLTETKATDVVDALRRLGLHAMADGLGPWLDDPKTRHASTMSCFLAMAQAQLQANAGKRASTFLRRAELAPGVSTEAVLTGQARGLTKKMLGAEGSGMDSSRTECGGDGASGRGQDVSGHRLVIARRDCPRSERGSPPRARAGPQVRRS